MQEIAGYFKENTGAVIADFENAFLSSNNDMKALNKKVNYISIYKLTHIYNYIS